MNHLVGDCQLSLHLFTLKKGANRQTHWNFLSGAKRIVERHSFHLFSWKIDLSFFRFFFVSVLFSSFSSCFLPFFVLFFPCFFPVFFLSSNVECTENFWTCIEIRHEAPCNKKRMSDTKQGPWVERGAFPWRVAGGTFCLRFSIRCTFCPYGLPLFQLSPFLSHLFLLNLFLMHLETFFKNFFYTLYFCPTLCCTWTFEWFPPFSNWSRLFEWSRLFQLIPAFSNGPAFSNDPAFFQLIPPFPIDSRLFRMVPPFRMIPPFSNWSRLFRTVGQITVWNSSVFCSFSADYVYCMDWRCVL